MRRPTSVDQAAELLSRRLHGDRRDVDSRLQGDRRDVDSRLQRDALAAHYGILSSDLAGVAPGVVELMALRVGADRTDEQDHIDAELRRALIRWLFRIGTELQDAAGLVADKPVADRLGMCVAELDECILYIRHLIIE